MAGWSPADVVHAIVMPLKPVASLVDVAAAAAVISSRPTLETCSSARVRSASQIVRHGKRSLPMSPRGQARGAQRKTSRLRYRVAV